MFGLKGAYFYLIALQVTFIKFFKKIYFSSSRYNDSLKSKIPTQVYFSPNPFLLSLISPYKKSSFKINDINPNDFWLENKKSKIKKHHDFLWLNLLDRKIDGKNIQRIIYLWTLKYSNFKNKIWENAILSSRVISWMLNIDIIINNGTFDFKKKVFQNIIYQCNHLRKNIKYEKNPAKRVQVLSALILSGIVFKEYRSNYEVGIKELEKFVKHYFDNDGFPLTRNPNDLILFTQYLILCHENINEAQEFVPEFLGEIIKKNLLCIKFFKTPDDKLPLFNGSSENSINHLEKYLEKFKLSKKDKKNTVGGIFFAKTKNQILYFDIGSPPEKNFSRNYQSGPLSFEYYLDGIKIISNSGFGNNISTKAELISKLTASQSTLTINDTSITKFERSKLINRVFGNSIKNTFKIQELEFKNDGNNIGCLVSHNGYEKNFSCTHKREIYLDHKNNYLRGVDHILKKSDGIPIRYIFRFYLNPELAAVKTMSGNSALIQISKNKSLLFRVNNESINIEKSIYLGGKKILENTCITISGDLVNKDKSFNWEIRKKI